MFKKILLALVAVVVVILGYAATQPSSFRVQRQISIKAPPEKIFAGINDFKQWVAWSPWEKMDSAMTRTYSPVTAGPGANYAWASDKVGHGRMEILESTPFQSVKLKLDFSQPFEAHNLVDFTIQGQGDSSQVTWAMYGPANFVTKLVHVFVSMDAIVGKDFESGLRDMKVAAEK